MGAWLYMKLLLVLSATLNRLINSLMMLNNYSHETLYTLVMDSTFKTPAPKIRSRCIILWITRLEICMGGTPEKALKNNGNDSIREPTFKERSSIYSLSKERVRLTVSKKLPAGTNPQPICFCLILA